MVAEKTICELVEHFSGVSGTGLFFLDKNSVKHPRSTARWKDADLKLLDYAEVIERLQVLIASPAGPCCSYETFFTQNGFVYNIHLIAHSQGHFCSLITEPLLVQPLSEKKIQDLGVRRRSSIAEKILFRDILLHVPVISWQRVSQLGMVLQGMCCGAVNCQHIRQTSCDTSQNFDQHQEMIHETDVLLTHDEIEQLLLEDRYQQIKHVIQTGDFAAMTQMLNCFSLMDCRVSQNPDIDFLRSAKNSFIMTCMLACFCAIEAGYPYHDAINLAHKLINETETLQDANAVFTNMKRSISVFTTAVEQYKDKTYSKTMHNVMLYVQSRYRERISLKEIADHVGHHPNYLSGLIKRETGQPLFEHINKIRVEMSKYELQHTVLTVAEIAQSVGFSHQNHYARIFKHVTGMTPSEFRGETRRIK